MLTTRDNMARIAAVLLLAFTFTAETPAQGLNLIPDGLIQNGDPSGDGQCDLGDSLHLLNWLFLGGPDPVVLDNEDPLIPEASESGDVNLDGRRDLADAVAILNYLYLGGGGLTLPNLYNCDYARQTTLKKHLPRAVSHAGTDAITLWSVLSDGLGQKSFTRAGNWSRSWAHRSNATGVVSSDWGRSLPLTSGFENGARAVFGSHAFRNGPGSIGLPFLEGALPPRTYRFQQSQSPAQSFNGFFNPRTVVASTDTSKTHFFGIQDDDGEARSASLRYPLIQCEASWNPATQAVPSANGGVQLRFTDHGLPTLMNRQPFGVEPGPNSACSMNMTRRNSSTGQLETKLHHFVFVTARFLSDTALFDKVTFLHFDGARWAWDMDLGSPVPNAEILGGPLAYTYKNQQGRYNMSIWVVARDRNSGDRHFRLYEKFFVDGGNDQPISSYFTGWTSHGFPSGPINGAAWPAGTKFWITTGMTHGQSQGVLRNNLFGFSDDFTDPRTGVIVNKQLVEHYFDNSAWRWGMILPSPDGKDFRTESCTVAENGTYRRLSVFGRSGAGSIYELGYTFTNGVENGWYWTELSCEPAFIIVR